MSVSLRRGKLIVLADIRTDHISSAKESAAKLLRRLVCAHRLRGLLRPLHLLFILLN